MDYNCKIRRFNPLLLRFHDRIPVHVLLQALGMVRNQDRKIQFSFHGFNTTFQKKYLEDVITSCPDCSFTNPHVTMRNRKKGGWHTNGLKE